MEEIKYTFSDLEVGEKYSIVSIERTKTMYDGKVIDGLKAVLDCTHFKLFTYLPKSLFKTTDAEISTINAAGMSDDEKMRHNLVNYGRIGLSNIGRILKPGEEVDENLLKTVGKMKATASPMKRSASNALSDSEGSPAKCKVKSE